MKEQVLSRFEFEEEFKEKLVELVLYKNVSAEQTARKYGLPNTTILINWINNYKRKLVQTLAKRLTEAASICLYNEVYNTKESKVAYIDSITKDIKKQLLKNNLFNQSSLMDIKITDSNSLSPNATRIGLILANYILYL